MQYHVVFVILIPIRQRHLVLRVSEQRPFVADRVHVLQQELLRFLLLLFLFQDPEIWLEKLILFVFLNLWLLVRAQRLMI